MTSEVFNEDCETGMKRYADGYFDLAVVDPPYGIGEDWKKRNKGAQFINSTYTNKQTPGESYFKELFRVSKHQIIWGYNYYTEFLGATNYLICWDKISNNNDVFKYSKFELAYTSIKIPANLVSIPWDGYRMGEETGIKKIHPHQKPVKLYQWLLANYANPGYKILDTHIGSGSSRIAAYKAGCEFVGFEIDPHYYEAQGERFITAKKKHDNQTVKQ